MTIVIAGADGRTPPALRDPAPLEAVLDAMLAEDPVDLHSALYDVD